MKMEAAPEKKEVAAAVEKAVVDKTAPMTMEKIPTAEKMELIDALENRGLFFRKFWGVSDVYWTNSIPTAAVVTENNHVRFLFNRDFWNTLPVDVRLFVICHEQLHLMNNHFARLKFYEGNGPLKNVAADVAINETLVRNYGFDRTQIPKFENYCWMDTVFKDPEDKFVSHNETAEYYYSILLAKQQKFKKELAEKIKSGEITVKQADGMQGPGEGVETLDDHMFSADNQDKASDELREAIEEALEEVEKAAPQNREVEKAAKRLQYKKAKQAGKAVSNSFKQFDVPIKKSRHWKRLYRSICKSVHDNRVVAHWAMVDKKMALLRTGLDLPGEFNRDVEVKTRVAVYLDVSGSCVNDTEFFLRHAMSLPKDLFEVSYFTFDTQIRPISSKPPFNIDGGGGTDFGIIQHHVENEIGHTDAVFVFTDGNAGQVTAKHPKKWFWFLTPDGTPSYITPGSRSFNLADFGWLEAKGAGRT